MILIFNSRFMSVLTCNRTLHFDILTKLESVDAMKMKYYGHNEIPWNITLSQAPSKLTIKMILDIDAFERSSAKSATKTKRNKI